MKDLIKLLDLVKISRVLDKEKSPLLSKEELKLLLERYKEILSKEIIEYLDSIIELEYSVIKDNPSIKNKEVLTELSIYRYASIYNIYNRSIKLIKDKNIPLETNSFDKPIDGRDNTLIFTFMTKSKKRIKVFEYDYNHDSPNKNKIPEYYYNRNLGAISLFQTLESKEQREKEINHILEILEYLYDKKYPNVSFEKADILIEHNTRIEDILKINDLEKRFTELDSKRNLTEEEYEEIAITNDVARILLEDMALTEKDFEDEDNLDGKKNTYLEKTKIRKSPNLIITKKIKYI